MVFLPIAALVLVILGAPTLCAYEANAAVVIDAVQQQLDVVHHPHSARISTLDEGDLDEISIQAAIARRQRPDQGAFLGASGGNTTTTCHYGTPDQVECLSAVHRKVPPGKQQGRTALISGHWDHVPAGCSFAGDYAAHYNTKPDPSNPSNGFTRVCNSKQECYPVDTPDVSNPAFRSCHLCENKMATPLKLTTPHVLKTEVDSNGCAWCPGDSIPWIKNPLETSAWCNSNFEQVQTTAQYECYPRSNYASPAHGTTCIRNSIGKMFLALGSSGSDFNFVEVACSTYKVVRCGPQTGEIPRKCATTKQVALLRFCDAKLNGVLGAVDTSKCDTNNPAWLASLGGLVHDYITKHTGLCAGVAMTS